MSKLLTYSSSKIEKSNNADAGYLTSIMYLAPYNLSGHNVCSDATDGCIESCLNTAGRGRFDNVQNARIKRTKFFYENRKAFLEQNEKETDAHIRKCKRLGLKAAIRHNGTSDIAWHKILDMSLRPEIQYYDYTKSFKRALSEIPANYHLTYSRSEKTTNEQIFACIEAGVNVSVVFMTIPDTYLGLPVIDGDKHDMRFLDPEGVIVGLKAKGKAKKDTSGFVVR